MYSRKIRLLSLNMILVMLLTLIPAQARGEAEIDKNEKKIYTITLDGKDGTLGNENRITVNYSEDNPLSLGNYKFTRAGYTLVGWTKDENNDEWVADRNGIITVDLGYETLYAMWKADDYLEDNVSLVIGGEDKSDLLNSTTECSGMGWTYRSVDDTTSELHLSDGYNGGNIVCKRDNVNIVFDASVSTSQIEVSGALSLTANSTSAAVVSEDSCAIRAKSVAIANTGGIYRIVSNTKTAIEAESLYLASGNVSIEGNPAVSNSLPVTCEEGIAYRSNQNADGLMSGLYSYRKNMTVTLKGNGGTLDGMTEEKIVVYSDTKQIALEGNGGTLQGLPMTIAEYRAVEELDLNRYPFTQEGYALVGWAADQKGEKLVTDATGHLKSTDYGTLYAVWLKVPDSNYVILQGSYAGAHATKAGFSSIAMAEDGTVTLPEPNLTGGIAIWRKSDTNEPYFARETVKVPSGTRFGCSLYYKSSTVLIFDGNGGTMRDTVNGVQRTVSRWAVSTSVGGTYHSNLQFVRNGYTMTGYNTEKDGSGKFYPYGEIPVTSDMSNQTILYAQWEKITPSGKHIIIDGKTYDAMQECRGNGWNYNYHADSDEGRLWLMDYHGGSIVSDLSLAVFAFGTNNTVSGSIESKETLQVSVAGQRMNNELTPGNLRVRASEGYALRAGRTMRLEAADGELNISGGENGPALYTQELQISCWENGFFEATGSPNALSYGKMIKDRYQTYLIRGGKDKESAVPITDDTYDNRAYISYEMRERVLTLHGNGGVTADNKDTFIATSKANDFDLGAYMNTFTNGDKRLLGWSKTENSTTIDYAAASSTAYCFDWLYEFAADLYAVWEGEEQRGVVLKNYGYFDGDRYTYSEQYTAVAEGGTYTLPESSRAGYIFKDWLGSDGTTYAAGDTIKIPTALSFTAQYEVGKLTVGGVTYTANRVHGSDALGWMYYPDGYNGYYSGEAQMNLYKNYSSGPITLDGNLTLAVGTDLTGTDNLPAISVTGDMNIRIWGGGTLTPPKPTLTGGENAPAIKVGGTLHLGAPVTLIGGEDASAMEVGKLDAGYAFLAGESKETATRVGTYNNEHYVRMDLSDPVTFQVGDVAPDLPDTETYRFIGWSVTVDENNSRTTVWYLPGEEISGSEKTLTACYVPNDEGMIFLDGNGAVTAYGVRYSDAIVHLPSQAGWRYMNADELKAVFHRDGFELTGFVGPDPDSKTDKLYTLNDLDALSTVFDDGQLHMGKTTIYTARWERIGDKTEDNSAYYTKADDGTVKIESVDQAVLEEQLKKSGTVQIDLSKLKDAPRDVILPVSAVNNVLDLKVEALSIKMADAVVTLDKTAMQSVIEMANGADIQLHVSTDDALSGNQAAIIGSTVQSKALDVSLTANGTEIHNFDGKVTISVPFTWTKQGVLQAWYLAENNTKEAIDVAYRDGNAVLTLSHFSTYAVTVTDAPNDTIVNIGKNSVTVNAPEGDSCVAALFSADGRQLAVGQATVNQGEETTVTWGAVNSAEVLTLKLFWLDAKGAPTGSVLSVLVKVSAR